MTQTPFTKTARRFPGYKQTADNPLPEAAYTPATWVRARFVENRRFFEFPQRTHLQILSRQNKMHKKSDGKIVG